MAAYAAATSLETTIRFLKYRDCFWLDPVSEAIIRPVDKTLMFLQLALEELDRTGKSKSRKKINALDGRIKEALWRFEDLLESHLTDQYLLNGHGVLFSIDLRELQHDADSFIEEMDCMEKEYFSESLNLPEEEEKEEEGGGGGGSKKWKMIGLSDQFEKAKGFLIQSHQRKHGYGLFGMAGVGKTTLAKELFEDPEIRSHYDHHVWIKVGRKCRPEEYYLHAILAQVDPTDAEGDWKDLKRRLKGKKCLIVLDDVWGPGELVSLLGPTNEEMMASLTNKESGIFQILLTGRDRGALPDKEMLVDASYQVVRLMNDEESKDLLCAKVFGEGGVLPSRLEKAAKKIVKKCEGLPLLIVAVADCLSERDMTEEYWYEVEEERNSVFMDALDEISKVLFPSYEYLPQRYKMFFLYLGVFPPDCEISPSKLMNMLIGEGWFLQYIEKKFFERWRLEILGNLCLERYMVLFDKKSIYWNATDGNQIVKICRLHRAWRHLCQKEARRNKFYQVLNRWADFSEEVIKGQRGLCLHNNMLFAIKDLLDSVQLNCSLSTRSLLCFGPYHQYPVPIHAGFKFLRELDALKLRFYTFPTEILQLVHLKYLALTCNGELPSTISKLFNLRVLIVHPHTDIKIRGAPSYIPVQIWDMPLLQHIEILGRSIQAPYHVASADNLSILGVNASISNLLGLVEKFRVMIKLGVRIEVTPYDDDTNLLDCFHLFQDFMLCGH